MFWLPFYHDHYADMQRNIAGKTIYFKTVAEYILCVSKNKCRDKTGNRKTLWDAAELTWPLPSRSAA